MNERLVVISKTLVDPDESAGMSTNEAYFYAMCDLTVIAVCVAPEEDDSGATLDINDDGTGVIEAIGCADADVPGTWKSTHMGGAETPVRIAAGSKVDFDLNSAAVANAFNVDIWALTGEVFS